jgi:HPt (histidine-containing phosphotransfer) domain-containing protein
MPAFDHKELMDRIDGDLEFLEESIEVLEEDAAPLLTRIREAVAAGDADAVVVPAHTLKGLLSNFCADAAESAAREIEARARANRLDGVNALVQTAESETERLRAELETFLGGQRR